MGTLSDVEHAWLAELANLLGAKAAPPLADDGGHKSGNHGLPGSAYVVAKTLSNGGHDASPLAAPVTTGTSLDSAIVAWSQALLRMALGLAQLKGAILLAFAGEAPVLVTDIDKKLIRLDEFSKAFDHSLVDTLSKAKSAADPAARQKSTAAAKSIVVTIANHLKTGEKFLSQLDANPFGVKLDLRHDLSSNLEVVSKAIH